MRRARAFELALQTPRELDEQRSRAVADARAVTRAATLTETILLIRCARKKYACSMQCTLHADLEETRDWVEPQTTHQKR